MICAVIDTNILVSSLISPEGNEAYDIRAIRIGLLTPCITTGIVHEYREVLGRPKLKFPANRVTELIRLFEARGLLVQPAQTTFTSPDPTDTKFLQCAIAGLADFLVTGNRRHFPASPYGSTVVINAFEMLARIKYERPQNL